MKQNVTEWKTYLTLETTFDKGFHFKDKAYTGIPWRKANKMSVAIKDVCEAASSC